MPRKRAPEPAKKRLYVVANWKMNKTIREALKYVEQLNPLVEGFSQNLWLAVPFTAIHPVREMLPKPFLVGAQNMNDATSGAFTGEIAAVMIKDAGADFVLLGHSERRQHFHETNEFINKKVLRALESSIQPLLCIGEQYDQRQAGETESVLREQLEACLKDVSAVQMGACRIAYEPIWAIGTGMSATPEMVQETLSSIRAVLESLYSQEVAQTTPILYGGSVTAATAEQLATTEGVDGFLIGTASLDPESFAKIARISENVSRNETLD